MLTSMSGPERQSSYVHLFGRSKYGISAVRVITPACQYQPIKIYIVYLHLTIEVNLGCLLELTWVISKAYQKLLHPYLWRNYACHYY